LVRRAQSLLLSAEVELVPNAGHAFPADHVDLIVARVGSLRARFS
jgi:hypothetical protein